MIKHFSTLWARIFRLASRPACEQESSLWTHNRSLIAQIVVNLLVLIHWATIVCSNKLIFTFIIFRISHPSYLAVFSVQRVCLCTCVGASSLSLSRPPFPFVFHPVFMYTFSSFNQIFAFLKKKRLVKSFGPAAIEQKSKEEEKMAAPARADWLWNSFFKRVDCFVCKLSRSGWRWWCCRRWIQLLVPIFGLF